MQIIERPWVPPAQAPLAPSISRARIRGTVIRPISAQGQNHRVRLSFSPAISPMFRKADLKAILELYKPNEKALELAR